MTTTQMTPPPPRAPESVSALGTAGLVALLMAYGLPVFNFFVVTVTLGSLRDDLGASPAVLQLVVSVFGVSYASTVVLGGRLGDNHGRRRVLRIGLVVMAAATLVCALAPSPAVLIAGRALQGFGAALVAPQGLSVIQASTRGDRRSRALAWFGAMAGVATCLAFLAGGLLVASDLGGLGWRLVFWLELVVAAAALLASRWIPESGADGRLGLDGVGVMLLGATVTLVVLPLTEGRTAGWPLWTWLMLVASVPTALTFVQREKRVERRGGHAVVPPSIIARTPMRLGLGITGLFFTGFGGFMFVFAVAAQAAAGMGPLDIGIALLPFATAFLIASLVGARTMAAAPAALMRRGAVMATVGFSLTAAVMVLTWPHFGALGLAIPMAITGLGQGWLVVPLFSTVLAGVPSHQAGMGGGLMITTMQMALGLGSAIVGTLFFELGGSEGGPTPMLVVLGVAAVLCASVAFLAHWLHRLLSQSIA